MNNLPYVIAVVLMIFLGVAAATAIAIARPAADNAAILTMIIGFIAPTTLSLLSFMKAQETHLSVNSRLDAFMASATKAARADGREEGRASADDRTDALAATRAAAKTPDP